MWYSNLEKSFIYRHILQQHWYTCPIALPERRIPQHTIILTTVSDTSAPPSSANRLPPRCESLYATNTSHRKQETFLYEYPLHWTLLSTKEHTTERWSSVIHSSLSPFWLLKPSLNMRMRECYLNCYEAGLCCYLVIHIEDLLRPLQLFYFHVWLIYWLSLV
jgi:hypothetical protein